MNAVVESPTRWPLYVHGTQRFVFARHYPYSLIYRIGPPAQVVAIAHSKRRPGFWSQR